MVIAAVATAAYLLGPLAQSGQAAVAESSAAPPKATSTAANPNPDELFAGELDDDEVAADSVGLDNEGAIIEFSYCTQCSFKGKAQEQIQQVTSVFPGATIDAHNHSSGILREGLAQVCYWLSWALLGLLLGKARAVEAIGVQVPEWVKPYLENSLYTGGVYFLVSTGSTQLLATGAYEISLNGKLLHSRLDSGSIPPIATLISMLATAGLIPNAAAASQLVPNFAGGNADPEFGIGDTDEFG
jgi:selT/selW/selH-like putative selenoprotein